MSTCLRNGIKYKRHDYRSGLCRHCGSPQRKNFLVTPEPLSTLIIDGVVPVEPPQVLETQQVANDIVRNENETAMLDALNDSDLR